MFCKERSAGVEGLWCRRCNLEIYDAVATRHGRLAVDASAVVALRLGGRQVAVWRSEEL